MNIASLVAMVTRPKDVTKKNWKLARTIQKIRKGRQITQEELADRLNVSQSWLARIETGREIPNLKRLQQIARALDVKVKDLIPY
jgi:transcriptional regulator with XRE-family HTH domain